MTICVSVKGGHADLLFLVLNMPSGFSFKLRSKIGEWLFLASSLYHHLLRKGCFLPAIAGIFFADKFAGHGAFINFFRFHKNIITWVFELWGEGFKAPVF